MLALADHEGAEQLTRLEHGQGATYPALVVGARRRGRRVEHRLAIGGVGRPGRRELQPGTSQTWDHSAPVPSARTLAIRDGSSWVS